MIFTPQPHPAVVGYDPGKPLRRVAQVSVHTSPLATLGSKDAGGMNVYIRELSCTLGSLGIPVDVFTRRVDRETPEVMTPCDGVNVIAINAGPPKPLDKNELFDVLPEFAANMALYSLRAGVRYDVVHAHYWLSGWAGHLAQRYWDTPLIQMFHTTAHMKNAVAGQEHQEIDLRGQIERQLLGMCDSIIAANPDERADLVWRMGTPNDKVCTIPPGVNLDVFVPHDRDLARARLGLSPDDRVILFCGRVDPIKGIETLVDAVQRLCADTDAFRPIVLFIGGEVDETGQPAGPLAKVMSQTEILGMRDCFRFLGSQPQDQLPVFYSAADLVAVPSRYESFGLVAVEALACGTPVVASRVGGLKFTIDEGVAGLLAPWGDSQAFADAFSRILGDPEYQRLLAGNARASVERFSWPSVASSIAQVYQRLAAGQRGNLCDGAPIFAERA